MSANIIGLVDCDSFFASCEKVFRPDWTFRPVVVLSNNDGCVVARSPEAKALQIPMGEPYFRLKAFARAHGVVVRSANYALYGDMSRRVVETLEQWTPDVEQYSIDEAFLDLTSLFRRASEPANDEDSNSVGLSQETRAEVDARAAEIAATVRQWTGVPVSLGLGPTRTLAKAASRLAKDDFARTGRKHALLFDEEERVAGLKRLAIDKVWGVGRRTAATLQRAGVKTAFDYARMDPEQVRDLFSIVQERVVRELRGEQVFDATTEPTPQKSMTISRSFGETLESIEELEKPVSTFAAKLAARLRARKLVAVNLHVFVTTNRFNANALQRSAGLALSFPEPTNSTPEILSAALKLLRGVYAPHYEYKKAGVSALETIPESVAAQRRYLFSLDPDLTPQRKERDRAISETIDRLNARFGQGAVFFASEGVERAWRPNAEFVSPCCTTDWDALPQAR